MISNPRWLQCAAALAILIPVIAFSQGKIQSLIVTGYSGSVPVTQFNGDNYVKVESLARSLYGSLSFNGNQVILTLPNASSSAPNPAAKTGFSKPFLNAGIEQTSMLREWHSVLRSALENGYPITADGLRPYQAQASTNLRLAQAAASTEDDHNAAQFLQLEFDRMKQLNDKYLALRANLTAVSPDALTNDPLNQSLVACGHALGAMAANGQFIDDSNCH
jgi:hypothetical protein